MASAGVSGRGLAKAFGTTPQGASTKISRGVKSIEVFLKICESCDAEIVVRTKDGVEIPIILADIIEDNDN